MILKLGMDPWGLKVYTVYINDDHVLTLRRSNLVTIACRAYTRHRCQVSVYWTIGPLFRFTARSDRNVLKIIGNCEADQRLCFHYTDSTIPQLPKYEITSL